MPGLDVQPLYVTYSMYVYTYGLVSSKQSVILDLSTPTIGRDFQRFWYMVNQLSTLPHILTQYSHKSPPCKENVWDRCSTESFHQEQGSLYSESTSFPPLTSTWKLCIYPPSALGLSWRGAEAEDWRYQANGTYLLVLHDSNPKKRCSN